MHLIKLIMGYWTNLRTKTIKFWKKNKRKILIILIIWLIIIIINQILKNKPKKQDTPLVTYTPHVSVLDEEKEVPEKYIQPIENLIDTYFNYCNNKEYEKAYNLITTDCKEKYYPTLESFKGYVDFVFEGKKKIYNIQCYSIKENNYIYNLRILDDILANGTTDGYYMYEEKIILIEENGQMKLSIAGYIGEDDTKYSVEDDNMIIEISNKSMDYETVTYEVKITNKTDNYIVIADNKQKNEIALEFDGQKRTPTNMQLALFFVNPNSTRTQELVFTKFFDEEIDAKKLYFGAIRILKEYDWKQGTTEENLNSAVKLYGVGIDF